MGTKRIMKRSAGADVVLLNEAFEEFIVETEARGRSESTLKNYRQSYDYFCKFCGFDDDTETDEIKQQHLFRWMNSLKQEGRKPATINHYLRDVRTFLYWCMEKRYIDTVFKVEMTKGQEESLKLFTDDELSLLLEKPRRKDSFVDWRTWAIVNWVLATGNRASTICNLRIMDLNFQKKEYIIRYAKNKKPDVNPLSDAVISVIKEYIRAFMKDKEETTFLFPDVGGNQLTTNALRLAFKRYCKDRGVEHTNIHGLRHNFAKGWVRNNGNLFALQKILGHSTLEMTRKYVKLFAEDMKEGYEKYSPLDTMTRASRRKNTMKKRADELI